MAMVEISCIIVSWNAKAHLRECLRSLLRELPQDQSEVIVVDNASNDGSTEVVQREFPGVQLIRNPANLGFARANNIGIARSRGRYLCLINSDVRVLDGVIARMHHYLDRHAAVGLLGPRILNPDGTLQASCRRLPSLWSTCCRALALDVIFPRLWLVRGEVMALWEHNGIRAVDALSGCFWMVRREAIQQTGLLDENFFIYAEDLDWCKRFKDSGGMIVYFPEAEAIHFGGGSSANTPLKFFVEMQRAGCQYWKKHHSRPAYGAYVVIMFLHHLLRAISYTLFHLVQYPEREKAAFKMNRHVMALRWLLGYSVAV
jgi:hypothetical protein